MGPCIVTFVPEEKCVAFDREGIFREGAGQARWLCGQWVLPRCSKNSHPLLIATVSEPGKYHQLGISLFDMLEVGQLGGAM